MDSSLLFTTLFSFLDLIRLVLPLIFIIFLLLLLDVKNFWQKEERKEQRIFPKQNKLTIILIILLVIFFFPKPCGRYTSAASLRMERKCYGIKFSFGGAGGGLLLCWGICSPSKKPDFHCINTEDCISGCGWRATYSGIGASDKTTGCIVVNKNSQDYLEHNKLVPEERFPVLCYENQCAFRVKVKDESKIGVEEMIVGFQEAENLRIKPVVLHPKGYWFSPNWLLLPE